ncbi:NAD(P)/FAD-dependent oxidoreductase [bacterium]|nr:NAD(P)/FAD-dependent oxidoreductase [bacterium]
MISSDIIIIGGGAAGMFASTLLAEEAPQLSVLVLEKAATPLAKVRISGGGRCNLTHNCASIREFTENYPRGGRELIGPFHRFGPAETVEWFETHGVPLVTLDDGCLFPRSDTSEDVIRALLQRGVEIRTDSEAAKISSLDGGFDVTLTSGEQLSCKKLLVATGGGAFVEGLGHTVEPCVPSLFTFNASDEELTALSGVVVEDVCVSAGKLKAEGALLITHTGVSGPAVLHLSSIGARTLAENQYRFDMRIHWAPAQNVERVVHTLEEHRTAAPRKRVGTWSPVGIPSRLWKLLVTRAGVEETRVWGACSTKALRRIAAQVCGFTLAIRGKNRHREEFVTCGGVCLKEVSFRTLESRLTPGLYFAGEVLDIDALTGGFNLQAAWTTGYLAAQSMMAGP